MASLISLGITGLIVLAVTFFSRESAVDKVRKADLALDMLNHSESICRVIDAPEATMPYRERLLQVFNDTRSESMDVMLRNRVTVCLDQRLAHQDTGFFDRNIIGVYDPAAHAVSIYDNGVDTGRFLGITATDYGGGMINKLADKLASGENQKLIAGRYSCGKNCTTTKWKAPADFDQDTIAKNPALLNPPVIGSHFDF